MKKALHILKIVLKDTVMPSEKEYVNEAIKEFASAENDDDGITKHHPHFISKYGIEQATGHNWIWSEKIDGELAVILGGSRDIGVSAGSRASNWSNFVWLSLWSIGCRFACDSLNPVKKSRK